WQGYSTTKNGWTLGQNNTVAAVYAKFRDSLGNESSCVSGTITHDDLEPEAPTSLAVDAEYDSLFESPTLMWIDANDNGPSGVVSHEVQIHAVSGNTIIQ